MVVHWETTARQGVGEVSPVVPDCESQMMEFKSDLHCLADHELVPSVVCLVNGDGGDLYLGEEHDGRITGLYAAHQNFEGVAGLIASRTVPSHSLTSLSLMRQERRLETIRLATAIHKDEAAARRVLERLVEWGLVDAHGVGKSRTYTLSARIYRSSGRPADYVRQAGFDKIQQEHMLFKFLRTHGQITRKDVVELCRISDDQATYLLRKLCQEGKLQLTGKGRGAVYRSP
jgi:predicted HTH transcriptional regulator